MNAAVMQALGNALQSCVLTQGQAIVRTDGVGLTIARGLRPTLLCCQKSPLGAAKNVASVASSFCTPCESKDGINASACDV